jgi:uncharacterized protein YutE (UPF0331/DUF86 family)
MAALPNDPNTLKSINSALQEISNSKTRIEAEKDCIKDIVQKLHEEHQIPKRLINRLAKVWHLRNFVEEITADEEFQEAWEQIANTDKRLK